MQIALLDCNLLSIFTTNAKIINFENSVTMKKADQLAGFESNLCCCKY